MLRVIFVILLLAGYGLYSLWSNFMPSTDVSPPKQPIPIQAKQEEPAEKQFTIPSILTEDLSGLINEIPLAPGEKLHVAIRELPKTGCTQSALSREKINVLLETVPGELRQKLYQALELSEPVWSAQLYLGTDGTGLCLPTKNKLVMLSVVLPKEGWGQRMEDFKNTVADGIKNMGESAKTWFVHKN